MAPKHRPPVHPGEILLKDFLEPLQLSQKQFAEHLGWTYPRLNEIVNMHRGVTADSALAFAEAFGVDPEFWLNLQRDWDLWHAKQTHTPVKLVPVVKEKNEITINNFIVVYHVPIYDLIQFILNPFHH